MSREPLFTFEPKVKNWRSYVPLAGTLHHYRASDIQHDLVAGLVLGVITIPQAIAYAFLAGLPPEAGLYACLVPMVIYAVLGSSRHLVVGPVAVAALMVAATIAEHAPRYEESHLGIATVLSLEAGLFLWLLRLTQMGGIVNLLSHPVITGFINAAALLIIISQLPAFHGIGSIEPGNVFQTLYQLSQSWRGYNGATIALAVLTLLILWLVRRYAVRVIRRFTPRISRQSPWSRTGPIFAVIVTTLIVSLTGLDASHGIATVGEIKAGLPALTIPPFNWEMWQELVPASAMIALVAYVESYSVGTSIASRQASRLNSNQELIALGAANIGAAFTGAYPVAGSFSRSSLNVDAGARTPVSALVCMAVILLTVLFFTPLFSKLPQATLAAIVMVSVTGLVELRSIRRHWRISRQDAYTEIVTLSSVLLFDVETGLILGVLVSIAFFIRRSGKPYLALVGRVADSEQFRSVSRHDVQTRDDIAAIRIDENLYFANVNYIENKLQRIVRRRPQTRHVLLVFSGINLVDVSGIEMLTRFNQNLAQVGLSLHLAEVKTRVMLQLESGNLPEALSGRVFTTTDQALRILAE
ncbi:MAG: sulfate permease [Pseudomonadales bacterium]|jgi:SulP family sulfate permease|nr:sulfate permease [Pseudomonadales bacterium]MDP6470111.1 sulfate permease [Pseudomonadales bacterium]MDP6827014.1 sulfate permease [Pseudomonadales bacterium]MDP6972072.1 sulfate permease [Pseudomonadales bacterium]